MSTVLVDKKKPTLTLTKKVDFKKIERDHVRQSFSHGRSRTVEVETKKKRILSPKAEEITTNLTGNEIENRIKVLQDAFKKESEKNFSAHDAENNPSDDIIEQVEPIEETTEPIKEPEPIKDTDPKPLEPEIVLSETPAKSKRPEQRIRKSITVKDLGETVRFDAYKPVPEKKIESPKQTISTAKINHVAVVEATSKPETRGLVKNKRHSPSKGVEEHQNKKQLSSSDQRKFSRRTLERVLEGDSEEKSHSLASIKRARQKQKGQRIDIHHEEPARVIRDVMIPDSIIVSELANRMALRGADVVKVLMKMGMMVTVNQTIDGDTAELICTECGHNPKRVSDELDFQIEDSVDLEDDLIARPPVVTIMGHVDHGKTSLLDALRETDIVSQESGGITQHIGAYQVTTPSNKKITFVDTPGHAAFSEMRARGANITDVVILVVAADDGIKEQTVEAIHHAQSANVPIVVAINKIDKPESDPNKVLNELIHHGLVVEQFGGEVLNVEVSAKKKLNLDKLEEAISLQAEVLNLKANPNRVAKGVVVEAKMDKGRGPVATVLVQKGTLKIGDIFVAGTQFGRVRVLLNDRGGAESSALPSMPIEVLGFNGVPSAGDDFSVVENETRAKEIAEYRERRLRERKNLSKKETSLEKMMSKIAQGSVKELSIVVKTDVQGSLEAILASLHKISTDEVSVRILHGGVGAINESDVTLCRASMGMIVGFNVRANAQARELARRDEIDIKYYSIIYDLLDDMKVMLSGLLAPTIREKRLGSAEIRAIFSVPKVGKVAGCFVLDGIIKRGCKVRLLRDFVVVYEGELKSLRRFKDEVKEVKETYECGIAFENYQDLKEGDVIECFEIESVSRQL